MIRASWSSLARTLSLGAVACGGVLAPPSGSDASAEDGPALVSDATTDAPNPMCPLPPAGTWSPEPSYMPQATGLTGVWASSPTDVWVVGYYGLGDCCMGVVAHDGQTEEPPLDDVLGVWGASSSDIWLLDWDRVARWNGAAYSTLLLPFSELDAIWGTASSDVWVAGGSSSSGIIGHWDGSLWSQQDSGATAHTVRGLGGSGTADVWAVGDGGTILHWNGVAWSSSPSGTTQDLIGVWAVDSLNAWAVGSGVLLRWDGTAWSAAFSDANLHVFKSVWAANRCDVWVVGDAIVHWDGATWSVSPIPKAGGTLASVWGTSPSDVWAVGQTFDPSHPVTLLHYH